MGNNLPDRIPRRDPVQHARDKSILARLAFKNPGATSEQLSTLMEAEVGYKIAPRTIRDDLAAIKKQWLAEAVTDFGQLRAVELRRVDALEQEAWDAWEGSKDDFIKTVIEKMRGRSSSGKSGSGTIVAKIVAELADKNAYVNEEVIEKIVEDALKDAIERSVDSGEDSDMFISKITETTETGVGNVAFLREIHSLQKERRKILGVYAPEMHELNIRKVEVKGYVGWTPDNWDKDQEDVIDGEVENG